MRCTGIGLVVGALCVLWCAVADAEVVREENVASIAGVLVSSDAGRPNYPGWQGDPRLICVIEVEDNYALRVMVGGMGNAPPDVEEGPPSTEAEIPCLLTVTLRDIVDGGDLEDARDQCKNEF